MTTPTIEKSKVDVDDATQVLIHEVRRRSQRRRLRIAISVAVIALGVGLAIVKIAAPSANSGSGQLIPYVGSQKFTVPIRNAVNACQTALTGYQQVDGNSFASGRAASVRAAYPTTAGALAKWRGAAPGDFAGYPASAPFDVCYVSGRWMQNPADLMGSRAFHAANYVIWTAKTPHGHPSEPRRFMTSAGELPPPRAHT